MFYYLKIKQVIVASPHRCYRRMKMAVKVVAVSVTSRRSKIKNSSGPRFDSCGTPEVATNLTNLTFLCFPYSKQLLKYSLKKCKKFLITVNLPRLWLNFWSNVLLKSVKKNKDFEKFEKPVVFWNKVIDQMEFFLKN